MAGSGTAVLEHLSARTDEEEAKSLREEEDAAASESEVVGAVESSA